VGELRRIPLVNSQYFSYDYYSGSNVGIYIADKLLTNIVGVEFSLVQTKRPVFGYASQLFDGVAAGVVQASGVLHTNFIHSQYLPTLIDRHMHVINGEPNKMDGEVEREVLTSSPAPSWQVATFTQDEVNKLKSQFWKEDVNQSALLSDVPLSLNRPDFHQTPIEIRVSYGDPQGPRTTASRTIRRLKSVHITGLGQTVQVSGEPVIESYTFIAREVI
jgi:hypothetical protein